MVEILIWTAGLFAAGGLLVLERRCLGQMAVVQPAVVCFAVGWLTGRVEAGLWLGVTLQLLSVGQTRRFDWAVAGVVAGAAGLICARLGVALAPGGASICALITTAVLAGFGSQELDRWYARIDGRRQRASSPFAGDDPAAAIERLVRRMVGRWLVLGGALVVVGSALAAAAAAGIARLGGVDEPAGLFALAVPAMGAGVALASLAGLRFAAVTGISAALSFAVLT